MSSSKEARADKPKSSSKKRSRSDDGDSKPKVEQEDNLVEVDLSKPAPLSKRQKRLLKKGKLDESGQESKASIAARTAAADNDWEIKEGQEDDSDSDSAETAAAEGRSGKSRSKSKSKADEKRAGFGIWIGNLPWRISKDDLRFFFLDHLGVREPPDTPADKSLIRRIHMPAPSKTDLARIAPGRFVPSNKGFAYVDFDSEKTRSDALLLSETEYSGRRVLIKRADNFAGRPEPAPETATATAAATGTNSDEARAARIANTGASGFTGADPAKPSMFGGGKPPCKRVFVGNLSFDATREDLETLYRPCGEIALTHVATFEDSGKCKGYAWITFEDLDSATNAVRGWITVADDEEDELDQITGEADEDDGGKKKKKRKTKKVYANRLNGRQLRCEYAEDADTRYAKRFGKDAKKAHSKQKVSEALPSLPANITGAIVAATGKRMTFD